ncbi:MAG: S9 family peptidase, partial [Planctomycetota bacterium]
MPTTSAVVLGLATLAIAATLTATTKSDERPAYPDARKGDAATDYHGTVVADPYRWLEEPEASDTRAFIDAQNKVTDAYLDDELKSDIQARLAELIDYPRTGVATREGGGEFPSRLFLSKNSGLQNHSVVFTQAGDEEPVVMLDPNTWSDDGTTALAGMWPSDDGQSVAYGISE